jgi:hypothetical protein
LTSTPQSNPVPSPQSATTNPSPQADFSTSITSKDLTSVAKAGITIRAIICVILIALGCFYLGIWIAARGSKAKLAKVEDFEKSGTQKESSDQ